MSFKQGSILMIVGPTGIGKTKLSISLALALGGEVVSVDSLQLYRDGEILTARARQEEMRGVRHHMVAYLPAFEEPEGYLELALVAINDIHSRGKVAILVGGSTSLTEPLLFHPKVEPCRPLVITLFANMEVIGQLCDCRIDSMIEEGLLEEIKTLDHMRKSLVPSRDAAAGIWKAIGFPELAPCVDPHADGPRAAQLLEDGVAQMKYETRMYADRQLRWIWTSLLHKIYQHGLEVLLFRVEGKETFQQDVEEQALELASRWLKLTRTSQQFSMWEAQPMPRPQTGLTA